MLKSAGSRLWISACLATAACNLTPQGEFPSAEGSEEGGDASGDAETGDGGSESTTGSDSRDESGTTDGDGTSGEGDSSGSSGSSDTTGGDDGPPAFEPHAGMLRRLTRTQFRNVMQEVFGVQVDVRELDPDSWNGGFAAIGASTVVTSEHGVEQYHLVVEEAVASVFDDPTRRADLLGCTPTGEAGDACVTEFVSTLGRRAWRRPLEEDEVDRLVALAESAAAELADPVEGARWATIALFTSPHFLYRAEVGDPANDGTLRLNGYEIASRLAFLLWNSLPDDALLDDAEAGRLDTPEGRREAAVRMLDAPQGVEAVAAFAEEYMRLDRIMTQAKDLSLYPEYGPQLQAAMVRDMRDVWVSVTFEEEQSVLDLFTTTKVVANAQLAELYGIDAFELDANTFEELVLPADSPRIGILGKAAFLSQFANQKEGSPTLRGKFISEALMCIKIPPPPPDVDVVLDEPPEDMPQTKRDRLELHRASPACAGCHALMDPMGLPLETFDAIGRYRTTEHGLRIDPSGEFNGEPVADARELGLAMGVSEMVSDCLVRKYYTYALGYEEREVDQTVIDALSLSFEQSGLRFRELILELVSHEAFVAVTPQP